VVSVGEETKSRAMKDLPASDPNMPEVRNILITA
jgi:hypothetical protein